MKIYQKKENLKVGYVGLIGRPNVGKSTLLNTMLGQKIAIISDKPQTTRISILGIKTTDKGQIIFIDNPGIHKPLHKLNKRMMNFVYSSLETSDLLCLLIDATQKYGHGDEFVIETLKKFKTPLFLLINKVDIVKKEKILLIIDHYKDLLNFGEIIPISALRGTNLDVLEEKIYEYLPAAEKIYSDDEISDQSERFLLAEIIREKLLSHVKEELPFVTAVYIDKIETRMPAEEKEEAVAASEVEVSTSGKAATLSGDAGEAYAATGIGEPGETDRAEEAHRRKKKLRRKLTYISATIFVERDNHRKIIIGRQGQMIKIIGIEARREIEGILETKVYLDLHVKVREKWRDSADVLDLVEGQK